MMRIESSLHISTLTRLLVANDARGLLQTRHLVTGEEGTSLDDDLRNLTLEEHTPDQQFCLSSRSTVPITASTAAV